MSSIQEINQSIAQAEIQFRNKYPNLVLPTIENTTPLNFWIGYQEKKFEEAFEALRENVPTNKTDWIKHKLLNCVRIYYNRPTFEFDHDPLFKELEVEEQEYDNNMKCAHCPDEVMVVLQQTEKNQTEKIQCPKCGQSDIKNPDNFTISDICNCGATLQTESGSRVCRSCGVEDTRVFQGQKQYGQPVHKERSKRGRYGGYYKDTLNTFTDNLKINEKKEELKRKIYDYLYKKDIVQEEIEKIMNYANEHSKIDTIKKIIKLLIEKNIDFEIENIAGFFGFTDRQTGKLLIFIELAKKMKRWL